MKRFINNWLANYALIFICINAFSLVVYGNWESTLFYFQLLFVTLVIRLLQLLTDKFTSHYPILEYLLELGMVIAVVLAAGWLFRWYSAIGMWPILVTIAVTYIVAYVLELTRTSRDIAYINEQIKRKRAQGKTNGTVSVDERGHLTEGQTDDHL
ncbi:MAG: hypothetical protein ACRC3H_20820 [Lachnospiraceae bacterium]